MDMQWFKGMQKSMVLMRSISIKVIQYQIMRKVFNDSSKRIIDRGLLFNPQMKIKNTFHFGF